MGDSCDIAIIGCGAAGLMAAIWAGRTAHATGGEPRIVALDGARTLGAKILVAGGGRCNVTHDVVDETAYAGSSPHAIRKVLLRFDVARTVEFFREIGVELNREDTGKLFPVTDEARTVLSALLAAARDAGVELRHPARVVDVARGDTGFQLRLGPLGDGAGRNDRVIFAQRVILCTGGMALPKSGSDGLGYELARSLGHGVTPHVFPALVPLFVKKGHWLGALSGIAVTATLEVRSHSGQKLQSMTGAVLLAHFGLSGPCVLDISRYWIQARRDAERAGDPPPQLLVNWLPGETTESVDREMVNLRRQSPQAWLTELARGRLPERLAAGIVQHVGIAQGTTGSTMSRSQRRSLAVALTQLAVPISGDRGFTYAEATAGGVPLSEIRLETMESRVCPGLHLCGEILDVDGRIGGYNFQWAWSSGFVAGTGAAGALTGA